MGRACSRVPCSEASRVQRTGRTAPTESTEACGGVTRAGDAIERVSLRQLCSPRLRR